MEVAGGLQVLDSVFASTRSISATRLDRCHSLLLPSVVYECGFPNGEGYQMDLVACPSFVIQTFIFQAVGSSTFEANASQDFDENPESSC